MTDRACPCLHTTPCHDHCTCVRLASNSERPYELYVRSCSRCCTYGSPEQQRSAAERIAAALDQKLPSIHDEESRPRWERVQTSMAILDLARTIGEHWRAQDGVSGALLDQLATLTTDLHSTPDTTRMVQLLDAAGRYSQASKVLSATNAAYLASGKGAASPEYEGVRIAGTRQAEALHALEVASTAWANGTPPVCACARIAAALSETWIEGAPHHPGCPSYSGKRA